VCSESGRILSANANEREAAVLPVELCLQASILGFSSLRPLRSSLRDLCVKLFPAPLLLLHSFTLPPFYFRRIQPAV
jgi:hypothetical protein